MWPEYTRGSKNSDAVVESGKTRIIFRILVEITMDEKEETRKMYKYEPGEAYDLFYMGIVEGYSGDARKAAKFLEDSIKKDSSNPFAYMYLLYMYEFYGESEEIIRKVCAGWVKSSELSEDEMQLARANYSMTYYNADESGRKKMEEDFMKLFKKRKHHA